MVLHGTKGRMDIVNNTSGIDIAATISMHEDRAVRIDELFPATIL